MLLYLLSVVKYVMLLYLLSVIFIVSWGNIYEIFENFTFLLEINTLANKSYVISKLIPLGKHVERS